MSYHRWSIFGCHYQEIPEKQTVEEKPLFGKGKILVMDDEEAVRKVAGNMLKSLGYEVEFAKDGVEAIEKLLEIAPEVKGIVSSGYFNDPIMPDSKKYGFRGVVAKPYKLRELSEELHRVTMAKDSSHQGDVGD